MASNTLASLVPSQMRVIEDMASTSHSDLVEIKNLLSSRLDQIDSDIRSNTRNINYLSATKAGLIGEINIVGEVDGLPAEISGEYFIPSV